VLTACPVPGKAKSEQLIDAFIAGAPREAEGAVFFGIKEGNVSAWERVLRRGAPFWFIDNAYFDRARGVQFRVVRNGIQHSGIGETDGKRLAALGYQAQPEIDARDGYVLVVHQSPVYMRLTAQAPRWIETVLKHYARREIRHRAWSPDKPEIAKTLHADLSGAALLVTHSSCAAVEAALAGVPVLVSKVSCCHTLGFVLPSPSERMRWAGVLADNQFSRAELKDGTAWRMLHRG
jgi:hypothetical protein